MNMDEQLPAGWVWTTLGEISTKPQYGWTTKANYQEGTVLLLHTTDISGGVIDWNRVPYCTDVPENLADYLLQPDDVVISRAGSVGISYLLKGIPKLAVFASYLIRFHPLEGVDSRYVAYYLQTSDYWSRIYEESSGIALTNVNASKLETIAIPLAPQPEQTRIVAAIEQQFTRIDAAVASLESARSKTRQYRASLLKAAVEGELTREWREQQPAGETGAQLLARILAERRARWEERQLARMEEPPKNDKWKEAYKEPQEPDVEHLPELPDGWCWATVEQVADVIGGVTKGRNLAGRATVTLPYLRVANVKQGFLDLTVMKTIEVPEDEVDKYLLLDGDILLTEGGDPDKLGRAAVWKGEIADCIHQNHIFRARLTEKRIPSLWLAFYANSENGRSYFLEAAKQTVNLASINLTQLRNCPIPLAPLTEQAQIVAEVEARLSDLAQMEVTIEHNLRRAEHERQSILREAFVGRLVKQEPGDEPASVLLERIREERKRREEIENERKKEERKMKNLRKSLVYKTTAAKLYHILAEAPRPLAPDELFTQAGLHVDANDAEQERGSVGEFYRDIDHLDTAGAIVEERPDEMTVLLRALDVPDSLVSELLETAVVAEEEQPKTVQTTLWQTNEASE